MFLDFSSTTGTSFFVDSATGASTNTGRTPSSPFATVAQAVAACTANKGDRIYLMPGHAETISAAAGIAIGTAGITITGLGVGSNRPTFTWATSTAATWTITAANVTIKNIRCTSSIDELVVLFSSSAANLTLDGVDYFETTSAQALQFLLTTAASDYLTVKNCFHAQLTAAAATQKWIQLVGCDFSVITDNIFNLTLKNETASYTIAGTTAVIYCEIARNIFNQSGGNTQNTIVTMATGSTGFMHDNRAFSGTGVATATAFVGDGCSFAQNYWADTAATSGLLAPVVDTDT